MVIAVLLRPPALVRYETQGTAEGRPEVGRAVTDCHLQLARRARFSTDALRRVGGFAGGTDTGDMRARLFAFADRHQGAMRPSVAAYHRKFVPKVRHGRKLLNLKLFYMLHGLKHAVARGEPKGERHLYSDDLLSTRRILVAHPAGCN
jgi:hypothetical protein